MKSVIYPQITFSTIYLSGGFLSTVLYWNLFPFLIFLAGYLATTINNQNLRMGLLVLAGLIGLLYQLYQWSYSFFLAIDASEGTIGTADYEPSEIISDWIVKLKLLIIRVYYYLPILLALIAMNLILANLGLEASVELILSGLTTIGTLLMLAGIWEATIIQTALAIYSYKNSLISSFNFILVLRLISRAPLANFQLALISSIITVGSFVVTLLLTPILAIPILGAVVGAVLSGFTASLFNVFLPNLYGQLWGNAYQSIRQS